jgi:cytochrome c peroxidase
MRRATPSTVVLGLAAVSVIVTAAAPFITRADDGRGSATTSGRTAAHSGQPSSPDDLDLRALARLERPPLGLPPVPVLKENPPTVEKIRLGRTLFLDRRLSVNGTLSCAMCHVPEQGFTVNEIQTAVGHEGKSLRRNAPTVLNVAYGGPFFHDGREPGLHLQPIDVLVNPDEMAAPSLGALVTTVRALPPYEAMFDEAFGAPPTVESIGRAIAVYMQTLLSANSPFDRWYFGGEEEALDEAAKRGFGVFTSTAGCARCHTIDQDHALFRDGAFHDTGLGWHSSVVKAGSEEPVMVELAPGVVVPMEASIVRSVGEPPARDLGRYEVTGDPADRWRFKTPSLRNVALTAPYMHDGSFSTLREVIGFYRRGGHPHEGIDPLIRPLDITDQEIDDLLAFLGSLTGDNVQELIRDARSEEIGNPGYDAPRPR